MAVFRLRNSVHELLKGPVVSLGEGFTSAVKICRAVMNPGEADCNKYSFYFCSLFGHTSALGSHGCWQSCQNDSRSQLQENTFCLFSQFTVVPNESFYLAARGTNSTSAATNNKIAPAGFFFLLFIGPRLPDGSVKKWLSLIYSRSWCE